MHSLNIIYTFGVVKWNVAVDGGGIMEAAGRFVPSQGRLGEPSLQACPTQPRSNAR